MYILKSFLIVLLLSSPVYVANANDTLSKIIDKKLSQGLSKVGNTLSDLIPVDGDTEVTISEQDNYDIKFSVLAVRPILKNPYQSIRNEHLYFTQISLSSNEPFANGNERTLLTEGIGFRTSGNNTRAILESNLYQSALNKQ